jgi:ketosteroid isomerase-like protein
MTRAEIEQLVRKLYTARIAGDLDEMMRCLAPDVHFELVGDPTASPVAARSLGHDNIRPHLAALVYAFKFHSEDIITLIVEGSKAAVRSRARITSTLTGATIDTELADFIEFKDGRIVSFIQFCDTALAAKFSAKP